MAVILFWIGFLQFHVWNIVIAAFLFLHWSSIVSYVGNLVYKFSVLETAHSHYTAVKAGCVVWLGLHLRDVLNGSTTAFARKHSLSVHARKWVYHFYGFTPFWGVRRRELISCLFEVCLNLQSIQANNKKLLKCSWSRAAMIHGPYIEY